MSVSLSRSLAAVDKANEAHLSVAMDATSSVEFEVRLASAKFRTFGKVRSSVLPDSYTKI